jgi:hypothetical protein
MVRRMLWCPLLLTLILLISGCPKVETTARDAIAGAKTTTDTLKTKYGCVSASVSPTCATIYRVIAAKDVTIDALEVYCGGAAFDAQGGACTPPAKGTPAATQAAQKLQSALSGLQQTLADAKGL